MLNPFLKILITTDLYTVNTNGVVTSVRNLSDALIKRGHDVKILTLSDKYKSYKKGNAYYVRSIPLGAVYPDIRMSFAICHPYINEIIDWKPDIIHNQCEFFTLEFAKKISKKTGAPIVHTYHTMYEQYIRYILPLKKSAKQVVGFLARLRLKKVKAIITPTEKVKKSLLGYRIDKPIYIMPTGINLDQHKARISPEERSEKRGEYGIPNNAKVLINLGRLGTEKNLSELIAYFEKLSQKDKNLYFLIVGVGPAENELKSLAKKTCVADKIIFTGMVEPKNVHLYYQIGDVFVSASTSETQGLTYVEAAANGLPLLCREDPCLEEVIDNGNSGFTYNDYNAFEKGFFAITQSFENICNMGKKSAEMSEKFDKHAFAESAEKIYVKTLSS